MTVLGLALCLSLVAFAAIGVATSLALYPVTRAVLGTRDQSSRTLGMLRLLPILLAGVVAGLWVLPGFLWLEPRDSAERVTPALLLLTLAALLVIATGLFRGARAIATTRSLVRGWRRGAAPIPVSGLGAPALAVDDPFPVVAIAGILKPRLYVSRRVLAALSREELAAVVEHEAAHLRRRDNLVRLVLCACPDPLAWSPHGEALERAWSAATERESDAVVGSESRRLDLASALVKVARLAEGRSLTISAAAAFYAGDPIADRVKRLLEPAEAPRAASPRMRLGISIAMAGVMLLLADTEPTLLRDVYAVTEGFVRLLQ